VASDGGALPELVAHDETGLVTPAGDPAALAAAIGELLASPARCREMGEAGRARVLEKFTWERTAAETEALYRRTVVAGASGPAGPPPLSQRIDGQHAPAVLERLDQARVSGVIPELSLEPLDPDP